MLREYLTDLRREFSGYQKNALVADLLSGITVAAVALPLALAFGVSSGANAAAGMITAIISAFIIGALSGASYQISGPTGAMSAILIPLAVKHGLPVVLAAGLLSGVILVIAGVFKAGRIISFIPKAVITGFTSGIAIIIALGQIENFFGMQSHGEETLARIYNLFNSGISPNMYAIGIGLFVVVLMIFWPKQWAKRIPSSLVAVVIATGVQIVADFPVDMVGAIPKTLVNDVRLSWGNILYIPFEIIAMPSISIAALCIIESLLCGAVAGKMKGEKLRNDRELIAQGIGNILLPFFGGVPATAAIARTSVAIKSGARTRLAGIFQGVILLLSMFLLSPFMSRIPMAALAGVLIVTAWRMNEWEGIRYIFHNRFKSAISKFLITLACTVIFDLTIAIAVGCLLAMLTFIIKVSNVEVTVSDFDPSRLNKDVHFSERVQVIYVTGSLFFGSTERFIQKIGEASGDVLIFSMRGVPEIDVSGVQEILDFCEEKVNGGVDIMFCGVQNKVKTFFDRAGLTEFIGEDHFYWEAADAFVSLNAKAIEQTEGKEEKQKT